MKNKILIIVLAILVIILSFGISVILKQDRQLKSLKIQLSEKDKIIEDLEQEKNNLIQKPPVHPIEQAVQDCMKKEAYTTAGMSKCVDDSINDWNKEIDKYLMLIENVLPEDKDKLLKTSQEKWEEYKQAQWDLIESTLSEKDGTMYVNIISGDKAGVVEQRAKDLSGFYFELAD